MGELDHFYDETELRFLALIAQYAAMRDEGKRLMDHYRKAYREYEDRKWEQILIDSVQRHKEEEAKKVDDFLNDYLRCLGCKNSIGETCQDLVVDGEGLHKCNHNNADNPISRVKTCPRVEA